MFKRFRDADLKYVWIDLSQIVGVYQEIYNGAGKEAIYVATCGGWFYLSTALYTTEGILRLIHRHCNTTILDEEG